MISQYKELVGSALSVKPESVREYPSSLVKVGEDTLVMCKAEDAKYLLAVGNGPFCSRLQGKSLASALRLCPLTHENRVALNKFLPFTLPSAFGRQIPTFGLGDRLGIASSGHIRCFEGSPAKPILAQQSKRELDLTGRTYQQVLDDVIFGVFQEGYHGGFGADGDHLKKREDIQDALNSGYTMITLDCSDRIGKGIDALSAKELKKAWGRIPEEYRRRIEMAYLDKCFFIGGESYHFSREELYRCALIYGQAVGFVKEIDSNYIKKAKHKVDFELSIDETESVTTAQGHLFVAMELEHQQIEITSLAPRFIGEFQKGIDYIGNIREFENQLKQHAAIADHFGYKLSIHSGSDKFSVFPLIGKYTGGRLHLKTSGTSWLEAVGVIAGINPGLYRRLHQKSLDHFQEAKAYYHVSGDPEKVAALSSVNDNELIGYLADNNGRQLIHITYGLILKDPVMKAELYRTLAENEEEYYDRLLSHIGRHLELLALKNDR